MYLDRTLDTAGQVAIFAREFKQLDLNGYFVVPLLRSLLSKGEDSDWETV